MKYLENAFKFFGKFFLLAIPIYIATALPGILSSTATMGKMGELMNMIKMLEGDMAFMEPMDVMGELFSMFSTVFLVSGVAALIGFVLELIVTPATYGMINKAVATDKGDLNDFMPQLKQNFVKYLLYWLSRLALGFLLGIAIIILFVILGLLTSILKGFGILLIVLAVIGLIVFGIALFVMLSLWFPAMVVDGLGVIDAAKKSIQVAKSSFWTILGISLLIGLGSAIVGGIVGLLGVIPIIGSLITSVVPAIAAIVSTAFLILLYRDKTGQTVIEEEDLSDLDQY